MASNNSSIGPTPSGPWDTVEDNPYAPGTGAIFTLVASHALATIGLAYTALVIHLKIDTSHPVFAVVQKEVRFLLVISLILLVSLLGLLNDHLLVWYKLQVFAAFVALNMHQVSWLAVTVLRYKLMVKMSPIEVEHQDLSKMRKQYLCLVSGGSAASIIVCVIFWIAVLIPHGRKAENVEPMTRFVARLGSLLLSNLPDYVSAVYYFRMWLHFKKLTIASNSVVPKVTLDQRRKSVSTISSSGPVVAKTASSTSQNASMRTLQTHVAISLADVLLVPFGFMFESQVHHFFYLAHCNALIGFWVPLLVVTRDFNQINGVDLREVCRETCGIYVDHN